MSAQINENVSVEQVDESGLIRRPKSTKVGLCVF